MEWFGTGGKGAAVGINSLRHLGLKVFLCTQHRPPGGGAPGAISKSADNCLPKAIVKTLALTAFKHCNGRASAAQPLAWLLKARQAYDKYAAAAPAADREMAFEEILIAEGLPILDLLDGAATGSRGGSSRNEIQAQGGVFRNGMGAFVNANWREGTRVDGGTGPDLNFSDQATVNLNVFIDLNSQTDWVAKFPWLKGSRVNLGVQNLFDTRTEVTSSTGTVPLNYQPDFLDPQGRVFSISLRKILF